MDSSKRERDSLPGPPPKRTAGAPNAPKAVIFTDLPPELQATRAFIDGLKIAYKDRITQIKGVTLLRDKSGFLVRTDEDLAKRMLWILPVPDPFSDAKVRLPNPPAKPQKRFQVLLRGVDTEISTQEIQEELERKFDSILSVERFHARSGAVIDRSRPLAIVRVTTGSEKDHEALCSPSFRLFDLLQTRPASQGEQANVTFCRRCLRWGHRASGCRQEERCSRCGKEGHRQAQCSVSKEGRCCGNCEGNHAASYRGCNAYRKAAAAKRAEAKRSTPATPAVSASAQMRPESAQGPPAPATPTALTTPAKNPRRASAPSSPARTAHTTSSSAKRRDRKKAVPKSRSAMILRGAANQTSRLPIPTARPQRSDMRPLRSAAIVDREEAWRLLEKALRILLPPGQEEALSSTLFLIRRLADCPATSAAQGPTQ